MGGKRESWSEGDGADLGDVVPDGIAVEEGRGRVPCDALDRDLEEVVGPVAAAKAIDARAFVDCCGRIEFLQAGIVQGNAGPGDSGDRVGGGGPRGEVQVVRKGEGRQPANASQTPVDRWILRTVSDRDESADGFGVREAGTVVGDCQAGFDRIDVYLHGAATFARRGDRVGSVLQILAEKDERIVVHACGDQAKDVAAYQGFTGHGWR